MFDDDVKDFEHSCMFFCFAVMTGHSEKKNIINQGDWLTGGTGVDLLRFIRVSATVCLCMSTHVGLTKYKNTSLYLFVTPWRSGIPFTG